MSIKDFFRKKAPAVEGVESAPDEMVIETAKPKVIDSTRLRDAYRILNEYKQGKKHLEQKIVDNEKWFQVRHWECLSDEKKEVEPASGWLFNALANKHASAMDNFPTCSILPREQQDEADAEALSDIIPVVLDQCNFEETYDEANHYKGRVGACCYGVFWNNELLNGLGNVDIKSIDLLSLFWEPGIKDIQKSRNIFHVEMCDNDTLVELYPSLEGKLGGGGFTLTEYFHDESIDTSKKTAVIDWYYKKRVGTKTVLHFCKFVGEEVIFATENEEGYENGWYDDGQYPFVIDRLFPLPNTPAGFGYIDVCKNTQTYIDKLGQSILENALWNAAPRYFVPNAGDVNEKEFQDRTKSLVHYSGNGDGIVPVQSNTLSGIYYEVYNGKIDELKETSGNRDVNTGGSASGVTAASAIAAMQEAGSRLDRDDIKASFRAYKAIILMVIERIRQFYDVARYFRILGPNGTQKFIEYSNESIMLQPTRYENGEAVSYRMPYFDVEIVPAKQSSYSRLSQNELILQLYQLGMFEPARYTTSLAALEMMDFDNKSLVMQKIAENGMMYQQMMMMAPMMGAAPAPEGGGDVNLSESKESSVTENARKRVAESTNPV